jgi:hypothetical protein
MMLEVDDPILGQLVELVEEHVAILPNGNVEPVMPGTICRIVEQDHPSQGSRFYYRAVLVSVAERLLVPMLPWSAFVTLGGGEAGGT